MTQKYKDNFFLNYKFAANFHVVFSTRTVRASNWGLIHVVSFALRYQTGNHSILSWFSLAAKYHPIHKPKKRNMIHKKKSSDRKSSVSKISFVPHADEQELHKYEDSFQWFRLIGLSDLLRKEYFR